MLETNGSSQYLVGVPPSSTVGAYPFTMAGIVRFDTAAAAQTAFSLDVAGVTNERFCFGHNGGGASAKFRCFAVASGGTAGIAVGATTVSAAVDYAVVAVFRSATDRELYVEGVSDATNTTSVSVTLSNLSRVRIGGTIPTGVTVIQFWDGGCAEMAVYNAEWSLADIAAHAKRVSPLLIRPQNLVFYAPLVRDFIDLKGLALTNTGGATVAAHPRIIMPPPRRFWTVPAAGGSPEAKTGADTLLPMTAETAALLAALGITDGLAPMLGDAGTVFGDLTGSDGLAPMTSEAALLLAALARTETLSPYVGESLDLLRASIVTETLALLLSDAGTVDELEALDTKSGSDTLAPMTAESASIAAVLTVADALLVALEQIAALAAAVQASDAVALGWADLAAILGAYAATDTLSPATSEQAGLALALQVADTLGVSLAELAEILASEAPVTRIARLLLTARPSRLTIAAGDGRLNLGVDS